MVLVTRSLQSRGAAAVGECSRWKWLGEVFQQIAGASCTFFTSIDATPWFDCVVKQGANLTALVFARVPTCVL